MSQSHKMYFDSKGYPRADFGDEESNLSLLGVFLSMDVSGDVDYCDELIGDVNSVLEGRINSSEGTGNLFTVTLDKEMAVIENAYNNKDRVQVPIRDFLTLLREWRSLLLKKPNN
jgi:hypothetical protein